MSEPRDEDVAAGVLAEAERLLGITGPRVGVIVDGHAYRLMDLPVEQPAKAAAVFADMLLMARQWLGNNPEFAQEISDYEIPMDEKISAMPLSVQIAIFLALGFEVFAHKHDGRPA